VGRCGVFGFEALDTNRGSAPIERRVEQSARDLLGKLREATDGFNRFPFQLDRKEKG